MKFKNINSILDFMIYKLYIFVYKILLISKIKKCNFKFKLINSKFIHMLLIYSNWWFFSHHRIPKILISIRISLFQNLFFYRVDFSPISSQ